MPEIRPGIKLALAQWLIERRDNCLRIAHNKTGADRVGWLEDAEYFQQAIHSINQRVRVHKRCGGVIISEVFASDTQQDYYAPRCLACGVSPETLDMEYIQVDPKGHQEATHA